MADDTEGDQPDQSIRDRRQAQGAAADLSRMGIDPRSLGLGEPERPAPVVAPEDEEPRATVHALRPEFSTVAPPPTEPVDEPSAQPPTELLPPRPADPRPVPRQPSRLLRTVARGMVTPDSAVGVQNEREAVEAIRQRQTERRIVAFIAGKGGVGCTTVAIGVGTAFVALREDRSVVVDVQQGSPSLGRALGADVPRSVASMLSESEVTTPPAAGSGLRLVDGSGWDQGLTRSDVAGVLDRLRADHTFNLLDVGDDAGEGGHAALARADQVVVVTGPGEVGLLALATALDRARGVNPTAAAAAVHVVVCPHEQAHRDAQRQVAERLGVTAIVVPPDPHLLTGEAYDPARVSPDTREAMLRVAGLVASRGVRR